LDNSNETDIPVTKEQIARKERSINKLKLNNVPCIDHLPVIEDITKIEPRDKEDVVNRAISLCIVALKGEGLEQEIVLEIVKEYAIKDYLSPAELRFIYSENPSEQDRIQFGWRYECYWVMLWALGYIDELGYPDKICDVIKAVKLLHDNKRDTFFKNSNLRPLDQILDEADLIYRYHWAVVDARINNKEMPGQLDPGVVMERHHALNWLISYMDSEWDDVSTDT
jgi:hypothetical protein